jgi:hypothetical protein
MVSPMVSPRSARQRLVLGAAIATAALVPAAIAWACVGVVSLTSSSATVQAGGKLTLTGREFAQSVPIQIHLDSPTGPVLATVPGPSDTMTSKFTVDVTIPVNIPTGQHYLVATQDQHDMNSGEPARSVFYVGTSPPASAAPPARPAALAARSAPGAAGLVAVAVGVAAVALLVAGALSLAGGRRGSSALPSGAGAPA